MGCQRREERGSCVHTQCPFPEESGFECVDVLQDFCEVGDGCVDQCPYSWPVENEEMTAEVGAIFEHYYGSDLR